MFRDGDRLGKRRKFQTSKRGRGTGCEEKGNFDGNAIPPSLGPPYGIIYESYAIDSLELYRIPDSTRLFTDTKPMANLAALLHDDERDCSKSWH